MSSDPPPSVAEPRRSADKQSAAREDKADVVVDLDRDVSCSKGEAGGCLIRYGDYSDLRIPSQLCSKRQDTACDELGRGESSVYASYGTTDRFVKGKTKGLDPLPYWPCAESDNEQGYQDRSATGDTDEIHAKVDNNLEEDKLSMSRCQLFVNVGGSHISVQKNLNTTTANMLVEYASQRLGLTVDDFYCTCSGKYLEGKKLLSFYPIERDFTIKVQHRLRAGRPQTIQCRCWDTVLLNVPRFHVVALPSGLIDTRRNITSAKFLSGRIQGFAREALIALCMIHNRGSSLNGAFNSAHILFHKGRVLFDDVIPELCFNPDRGRNDLTKLHGIFRPVFFDETVGDFALHAEHLLNFLLNCPAGVDLTSLALAAFLTNHCAVQTYVERISTCNNLHSMIEKLNGEDLTYFKKNIGAPPNWLPIKNVPEINAVYNHRSYWDPAKQKWILLYSHGREACVKLARNFFKHAPRQFSREELEAAFSATMAAQNFLPNTLQQIAVLNPPVQAPDFDFVKLLGNNMVD